MLIIKEEFSGEKINKIMKLNPSCMSFCLLKKGKLKEI